MLVSIGDYETVTCKKKQLAILISFNYQTEKQNDILRFNKSGLAINIHKGWKININTSLEIFSIEIYLTYWYERLVHSQSNKWIVA